MNVTERKEQLCVKKSFFASEKHVPLFTKMVEINTENFKRKDDNEYTYYVCYNAQNKKLVLQKRKIIV